MVVNVARYAENDSFNSLDPSYKELIIKQEDIEENQFNVVGEFVAILEE